MLFDKYQINVFIWEPVATSCTHNFVFNPAYPAIGSELERNYSTLRFSLLSREISIKKRKKGFGIFSFGIADELMNFYETNPDFFEDGCHLNKKGLNLAIKSFKNLCNSEGIKYVDNFIIK
jgi:hypothetical protein